jgi:branched-chain amino acid transport system permease protein
LALATLAAHFIIVFFANLYEQHVPAAQFSGFIFSPMFGSQGLKGAANDWAWLLAGVLCFVILGASRVMKERSGRALRMLRDHEHVAPVFGINAVRLKLAVFTISSMVIGGEGALLARFTGAVNPDNFTILLAFQYIIMIVIGGLDSIMGGVIGAAIVIALPVWIPSVIQAIAPGSGKASLGPNVATALYGVLVIIFVTASPGGIMGLLRRFWYRLPAGFTGKLPESWRPRRW